MTLPARSFATCILLALAACGGGSPSGPSPQAPTPEPGYPVSGFVYYDENANGVLDGGERIRLPDVRVSVAGRSSAAGANGSFVVEGVRAGAQSVSVVEASLPPYYVPGAPQDVSVPQAAGTSVALPVTLPIGANRPNVYLAFGDSITEGDGSGDGYGYRLRLETDLALRLGDALVLNDAKEGSRSDQALGRLSPDLITNRPAYTLILYGTNDWNRPECKDERFPCFTIDSLRTMVAIVRSLQSLPVLSTIIPANPAYLDRDATARNEWVVRMNALIEDLADELGVPLSDPHALFLAEPQLEPLFSDHVHPSDPGYDLIAAAFLDALTGARGESGSVAGVGTPSFGWPSPFRAPIDEATARPPVGLDRKADGPGKR